MLPPIKGDTMKQIKMTEKKFPESDPGTWFTALVDGKPIMEFSRRDGKIWYRNYAAPITMHWMSVYQSQYYSIKSDMNICRKLMVKALMLEDM